MAINSDNMHDVTVIITRPDGTQRITRLKTDTPPLVHSTPAESKGDFQKLIISWPIQTPDLEIHFEDTRETGREIVIPPILKRSICENCGLHIVSGNSGRLWQHEATGQAECYPKNLVANPAKGDI